MAPFPLSSSEYREKRVILPAGAHAHGRGRTKARLGEREGGRGRTVLPETIQGCGAANHLQLLAGGWGSRRPS